MLEESILLGLVENAQQGDEESRRELIERHTHFIASIAALTCKKRIGKEDDEMSIGLIAFNEAIDRYHLNQQKNFYGFARMLIQSRLIDHFRKERKHRGLASLDASAVGNGDVSLPHTQYEVHQAMELYQEEQLIAERAEEIVAYSKILHQFGIKFSELESSAPKHADSRAALVRIAHDISSNPQMVAHLRSSKQLPLKEIEKIVDVSRKTLERGRKYLIALIVIIIHDEFMHLKSMVSFPDLKGGNDGGKNGRAGY